VLAGWWEISTPKAGGTIHYQTLTAPQRTFIVSSRTFRTLAAATK
jgi:hypothetical protein